MALLSGHSLSLRAVTQVRTGGKSHRRMVVSACSLVQSHHTPPYVYYCSFIHKELPATKGGCDWETQSFPGKTTPTGYSIPNGQPPEHTKINSKLSAVVRGSGPISATKPVKGEHGLHETLL